MKVTCEFPGNASPAIGKYCQQVVSGVMDGWLQLPTDIQKIVEWSGLKFKGLDVPQSTNVFVVEVRIVRRFNCGLSEVKNEQLTSFATDDFRDGLSERVALRFRQVVLSTIEAMAAAVGKEHKSLLQLLV